MHNAPSVTFPVGRSFWAAGGVGVAWAMGVLATLLWSWQSAAAGWALAMVWTVCMASGAGAAHAWARSPAGRLHWSGSGWLWQPSGELPVEVQELQVTLDFQHVLLMRLRHDGRPGAWLWAERRSAPGDWMALRRAVYSRANPDGLPGAMPPPATP